MGEPRPGLREKVIEMEKTTKFYGIKEIVWKFGKPSIENIIREHLHERGETESPIDYSLKFIWDYNDDEGEITGVRIIKNFKQEESPKSDAPPSEPKGKGSKTSEGS